MCDLGIRGLLVYDEGLLWVLSEARKTGELPADTVLKASAHCGHGNGASFRLLEQCGADSINPVRDLSLDMLCALRASVSVPLDVHTDCPEGSGGFIRTYEAPEIVRCCAPVYLKIGNSALAAHGSLPTEADAARMAQQAAIVMEMLERYLPEARQLARGEGRGLVAEAGGPRMSERIETAALRDFSVSLCRAAGLSADDAALLTDSILFAECRGVTSHGLLRLPQYIARLRSGATASNVPMPFTMESGGTARLDAQNGLGQLAGRKASDKAEELAAKYGVSFVAVANSNHFGTGAWYAIRGAARLFAFNISSAASAMAPHGAAQPLRHRPGRAGTAARRGEGSLALDMALSTAARGKIRYAALNGTPIPETWGWTRTARPRPTPPPCSTAARSSRRRRKGVGACDLH